jgi:hypothetical protein
MQGRDPLYDVDPQTGDTIEVFYADRELETFGRCGAGWLRFGDQSLLIASDRSNCLRSGIADTSRT